MDAEHRRGFVNRERFPVQGHASSDFGTWHKPCQTPLPGGGTTGR
jgi:hypothetical protein